MKVESGGVGGDDRTSTFLRVLLDSNRNQTPDGGLRRDQHLYGTNASLDRNIKQKLRQLRRPHLRERFLQLLTPEQVGKRIWPSHPGLRRLRRKFSVKRGRLFLQLIFPTLLVLMPSPVTLWSRRHSTTVYIYISIQKNKFFLCIFRNRYAAGPITSNGGIGRIGGEGNREQERSGGSRVSGKRRQS
uniref:Uncharacterized protein MANES_11G156800 n=1 Tax=Rhizophora mucronata TaxID=61149 RepID=A0A2P2JJP7_RHIMU